ncbi:MAG: cyclic nucleotide-binding domain-containing protein, partial [Cytophagales bacterium]|nr:cyclic nucleotide-binding domain-containing protein [Cytophagales bacterium]
LWKKLELIPDYRIVRQILQTLRNAGYQANDREKLTLNNLLDEQIGKCFWNLKARDELPKGTEFEALQLALGEEIKDNQDQIYLLLALIYDPQSVQLVRENIDSETSEGIAFGMELLDMFLSQDLKAKLIPLLDDEPLEDKFKLLQVIYPRDAYGPVEVVSKILKRNNNLCNRWTKACALYAVQHLPDYEVREGILAHLFNPDRLIRETAAWVVYNKDPQKYEFASLRLPELERVSLRELIRKLRYTRADYADFLLRVEVARFLATLPLFATVRGTVLCDLVDKCRKVEVRQDERLPLQGGFSSSIYLVARGHGKLLTADQTQDLGPTDVFGPLLSAEKTFQPLWVEASSDCLLLEVAENDFCDILSDNLDLAKHLIQLKAGEIAKT